MLLQIRSLNCKAPKNPHAFFILPINRAPSDTLKKNFLGKMIYYVFFNDHEECILYQFRKFILTKVL